VDLRPSALVPVLGVHRSNGSALDKTQLCLVERSGEDPVVSGLNVAGEGPNGADVIRLLRPAAQRSAREQPHRHVPE
jgi:hypothetical protein